MYEIDLSTLMLIGLDDNRTRVVTLDNDFVVKESSRKIIDNSCRYFGSSLTERVNYTNRIVKMSMKTPIIVEDTRNIIFFPLKSTRVKNNIWVSFNNLANYTKDYDNTIFKFKNGKKIAIKYSYYIVDNQVTRSLILDYEISVRRKSLEK